MSNFTGVLAESPEYGINTPPGILFFKYGRMPSWSRRWDENWAGEFTQFTGWGTNWNTDFSGIRRGYRVGQPENPGSFLTENIPGYGPRNFVLVENRKFNFTGYVASSYSDVFYNRILIEPVFLDFGNILSTQSVKIEIFNGYLNNVSIIGLDKQGFDEGTAYTDFPIPSDLLPLEERATYVTASTSGDPQIDATITFTFSNGAVPITVYIVGSRIVLFPTFFRDDVKETLVWATDILNSYNGKEQRIKIRNKPRQQLRINSYLNRVDLNRLDNLIWGWRKRVWAIPMWIEAKQGTSVTAGDTIIYVDTRFADFRVGGLAVLFKDASKFDVFQIKEMTDDSITANREIVNSFQNPIVMPVRSARMLSDPIRSTNGYQGEVKAVFEVTDNIALPSEASIQQFNDIDTFLPQQLANEGDKVSDSYEHRVDVLDYTTGIVQTISPWLYTRVHRTFLLEYDGPEAIWNFRKWLHRRQGRLIPFYGSNSENAFVILSTGTVIDTLTAINNDYTNQASARKHIAFYLDTGAVEIKTIVNTDISVDGARVDIVFEPDLDIDVSHILSVQTVSYKRLSSDSISIDWMADHKMTVKIPTTELKP